MSSSKRSGDHDRTGRPGTVGTEAFASSPGVRAAAATSPIVGGNPPDAGQQAAVLSANWGAEPPADAYPGVKPLVLPDQDDLPPAAEASQLDVASSPSSISRVGENQSFLRVLTSSEKQELDELGRRIDDRDARYYEPIVTHLRARLAARDRKP